jgi:heat shock protein HtpX
VAVTDGILQVLSERELEAVLAHELSHVKNRDALIGTVAAGIAGLISSVGDAMQWGFALEEATQVRPYEHAGPATAHLFIVNPLRGTAATLMNLFSTHPPIQERIQRLQAMSA